MQHLDPLHPRALDGLRSTKPWVEHRVTHRGLCPSGAETVASPPPTGGTESIARTGIADPEKTCSGRAVGGPLASVRPDPVESSITLSCIIYVCLPHVHLRLVSSRASVSVGKKAARAFKDVLIERRQNPIGRSERARDSALLERVAKQLCQRDVSATLPDDRNQTSSSGISIALDTRCWIVNHTTSRSKLLVGSTLVRDKERPPGALDWDLSWTNHRTPAYSRDNGKCKSDDYPNEFAIAAAVRLSGCDAETRYLLVKNYNGSE